MAIPLEPYAKFQWGFQRDWYSSDIETFNDFFKMYLYLKNCIMEGVKDYHNEKDLPYLLQ